LKITYNPLALWWRDLHGQEPLTLSSGHLVLLIISVSASVSLLLAANNWVSSVNPANGQHYPVLPWEHCAVFKK